MQVQDAMFVYSDPHQELLGPLPPVQERLGDSGYLHHIKAASSGERAGAEMDMMSIKGAEVNLYTWCICVKKRKVYRFTSAP